MKDGKFKYAVLACITIVLLVHKLTGIALASTPWTKSAGVIKVGSTTLFDKTDIEDLQDRLDNCHQIIIVSPTMIHQYEHSIVTYDLSKFGFKTTPKTMLRSIFINSCIIKDISPTSITVDMCNLYYCDQTLSVTFYVWE